MIQAVIESGADAVAGRHLSRQHTSDVIVCGTCGIHYPRPRHNSATYIASYSASTVVENLMHNRVKDRVQRCTPGCSVPEVCDVPNDVCQGTPRIETTPCIPTLPIKKQGSCTHCSTKDAEIVFDQQQPRRQCLACCSFC